MGLVVTGDPNASVFSGFKSEKTQSEKESLRERDQQREGARNERDSWRTMWREASQTQPAAQASGERRLGKDGA